jgi:hypothetical protein
MGVRHFIRGILLVEHPVRSRHFQPVPGFLVDNGLIGFPGLVSQSQWPLLFNHLANIREGIVKSFSTHDFYMKA